MPVLTPSTLLLHTFEQLIEIAYKRELVAMRRLAARDQLPLEVALRNTLQTSAGNRSLQELIAQRQNEATEQQTRRVARKQQQADHRIHKVQSELVAADYWQSWFDGSCHPNPGKMGIGALLQSPFGAITEISALAGSGDSSEAEYRALIALLQAANAAQVKKLVIYGDSKVVIDDVQRSETQASQILCPLRIHAQQLLTAIPHVVLRWIPRHRNAAADALSQAAILNNK